MKNAIFRGFLVGSSLGVILFLAGLSDSLPRAFVLGAAAGGFAGYTLFKKTKK